MRETPEFTQVPSRVKQILKQSGGIPGYTYAMVLTENAGWAFRNGWDRVADQPVFTLVGTDGQCVDFELWCFGTAIRGASTASGARALLADPNIPSRTGLAIPGAAEAEDPTVPAKPASPVPSVPSKSKARAEAHP